MNIANFTDEELKNIMGNPSASQEEVDAFRLLFEKKLEIEALDKELELMDERDLTMAFYRSSKAEPNKALALKKLREGDIAEYRAFVEEMKLLEVEEKNKRELKEVEKQTKKDMVDAFKVKDKKTVTLEEAVDIINILLEGVQ